MTPLRAVRQVGDTLLGQGFGGRRIVPSREHRARKLEVAEVQAVHIHAGCLYFAESDLGERVMDDGEQQRPQTAHARRGGHGTIAEQRHAPIKRDECGITPLIEQRGDAIHGQQQEPLDHGI